MHAVRERSSMQVGQYADENRRGTVQRESFAAVSLCLRGLCIGFPFKYSL